MNVDEYVKNECSEVFAENYDLKITKAQDIIAIRIAAGNLATLSEIKNAPGCLNLNQEVITSHLDLNGNFIYGLSNGGIYSI